MINNLCFAILIAAIVTYFIMKLVRHECQNTVTVVLTSIAQNVNEWKNILERVDNGESVPLYNLEEYLNTLYILTKEKTEE